MDRLLTALSETDRLWVLRRLLEGPLSQAGLARELAERRGVLAVNPGSMHRLVRPLFDAGLVERPGARGRCALTQPAATEAVLEAVAGLATALANQAEHNARRSRSESRRLTR
jgi:DNA-binding transcriptional ArsR family regulator